MIATSMEAMQHEPLPDLLPGKEGDTIPEAICPRQSTLRHRSLDMAGVGEQQYSDGAAGIRSGEHHDFNSDNCRSDGSAQQ
jgi:hypothetical protein